MRRYDELTPEEQNEALAIKTRELLRDVCEGYFRLDDATNGDNLQAAIDAAIQEADAMRTPWFVDQYVWDARYNPGQGHIVEKDGLWPVSEALQSMAMPVVEDAWYPSEDETVVRLEQD